MKRRTIIFDESAHTYTDERDYRYTSVTTLIHNYVPPFDKVAHAKRLARKGTGHYAGKTYKEILSMWEEVTDDALNKGNNRHNFLEKGVKESSGFVDTWNSLKRGKGEMYSIPDILEDHSYGEVDLVKLEQLIGYRYPKIWEAFKYYVDRGFRVYSEIVVYDDEYLISGMIDILLVNFSTMKFVILDWKTNKHDIIFEAGYYRRDKDQQTTKEWVKKAEYFMAPLDGLEHCNGNVYSMQLSTYSKMVESFGLELEYIILAHIREHYQSNKYGMPYRDDRGAYIPIPELGERVQFHPILYYKDHVENMMKHHYNKSVNLFGNI